MSSAASVRVEKDLLGTLEVPADAYYGIQTLRAVQNFRLSGVPLSHYPKPVSYTHLDVYKRQALHYLGLDPNSTNPADYDKVTELLLKVRPYVAYFHSAKYMTDIANGDICVAIGYSGSFYQFANRAKEAGNGVVINWRLPKEGAPIWFDTWAIPKSAQNVDEAHAFINHLLEPKVIAPISDFLGYPNPNVPGMQLVGAEIADDHDLTPTPELQKSLYVVQPLPQKIERVRTRAWTSIKSGK